MVLHNKFWVGERQQVWMRVRMPTGWRQQWVKRTRGWIKAIREAHKQYNNTEWENWRERWRQEWMAGGLAGVGRGTLPDHCKEGGVGQVSHQLQPWPSSLLFSLTHTHFLLHSTIPPLPLILPWSLSSAPINQSLLLLFLPSLFPTSSLLLCHVLSLHSQPLSLLSSLGVQWE